MMPKTTGMEFIQVTNPAVEKPLVIAAMQDMGHVGSLVIDFINKAKKSTIFRTARMTKPSYVIDNAGLIDVPSEEWEYKYTENSIIFGGGVGQPSTEADLHVLCQDVIDVAKKHSAKFIYTVGGFHTTRPIRDDHRTFVTTTSPEITAHLEKLNVCISPIKSIITGFNGLILGYAKLNNIHGIGLYGELNEVATPQYKTAKSIIKALEGLTYQSFGDTTEFDVLASDAEGTRNRTSYDV